MPLICISHGMLNLARFLRRPPRCAALRHKDRDVCMYVYSIQIYICWKTAATCVPNTQFKRNLQKKCALVGNGSGASVCAYIHIFSYKHTHVASWRLPKSDCDHFYGIFIYVVFTYFVVFRNRRITLVGRKTTKLAKPPENTYIREQQNLPKKKPEKYSYLKIKYDALFAQVFHFLCSTLGIHMYVYAQIK